MRQETSQDLRNRVTEELAKRLFSGAVCPDDFLPKETELSTEFGVSRSTIRSALETLSSLGVIKRISGLGTRVEAYSNWNILSPQVSGWIAQYANDSLPFTREIFIFRAATEPYMATEAARHANAHDLLLIENAWKGMFEASKSKDMTWRGKHFQQYDSEFHEAVYGASHNLVWIQVARSIRPAVIYLIKKTTENTDELTDSLERHRQLMEAIRLRQVDRAREAALSIIERTGFDLKLPEFGAYDETEIANALSILGNGMRAA